MHTTERGKLGCAHLLRKLKHLALSRPRVSQKQYIDVTTQADQVRQKLGGATEQQASHRLLDVVAAEDGRCDAADNLLIDIVLARQLTCVGTGR